MVTLVTRYQTEDGTLYDSREDAERHEAAGHIQRLMGETDSVGAGWIAAHLPELEKISRWPSLAKETVDEYLGVVPDEPEAGEAK